MLPSKYLVCETLLAKIFGMVERKLNWWKIFPKNGPFALFSSVKNEFQQQKMTNIYINKFAYIFHSASMSFSECVEKLADANCDICYLLQNRNNCVISPLELEFVVFFCSIV